MNLKKLLTYKKINHIADGTSFIDRNQSISGMPENYISKRNTLTIKIIWFSKDPHIQRLVQSDLGLFSSQDLKNASIVKT